MTDIYDDDKIMSIKSAELNIGSSSWRVVNFHTCMYLVFPTVVGFLISEMNCAFASVFGVIVWQFLIQLLLFLFLFFLQSFLLLFIFLLIFASQNNTTLVMILLNYI